MQGYQRSGGALFVFLLLVSNISVLALGAIGEQDSPQPQPLPSDAPAVGLSAAMTAASQEANNSSVLYPWDDLFTTYLEYPELTTYLHRLEAEHRDIARLYDITALTDKGSTWQGRTVWAMRITQDPAIEHPDRNKAFIVGNHHAREWMSYEVTTYTIALLLNLYNQPPTDDDGDGAVNEDPFDGTDNDGDGLYDEDESEARITWLVDHRDIWIVPMLNPDGVTYDHTISQPGDATSGWRKNVRDNNRDGNFNPNCDGVDPNRNYPWQWARNRDAQYFEGGQLTRTVDDSNPCSDIYHGPDDNADQDGDSKFPAPDWWNQRRLPQDWNGIDEDPMDGMDNDGDGLVDEDWDGGWSEPETQSMRMVWKTFLDSDGDEFNHQSDVGIMITYHSFSGLVIWPWGYTRERTTVDALFTDVGTSMANFTGYTPQHGTDLYPVSGDITDWLYGAHGVLAYTVELNTDAEGGFHPMPDMILPTVRKNAATNLWMFKAQDVALQAHRGTWDSLDIGVPTLEHNQSRSSVSASEQLNLKVSVTTHLENLDPEGVTLHYWLSRSGDPQGYQYQRYADHQVQLRGNDQGVYKGAIPSQEGGMVIHYWFSAKDVRGIGLYAPEFGGPDSYRVVVGGGLVIDVSDILALAVVALFLFGMFWVGAFRMIAFRVTGRRPRPVGAGASDAGSHIEVATPVAEGSATASSGLLDDDGPSVLAGKAPSSDQSNG